MDPEFLDLYSHLTIITKHKGCTNITTRELHFLEIRSLVSASQARRTLLSMPY